MLTQFREFLLKENLIPPSSGRNKKECPFLLTVSGGIDSVVMAELFYKAGLKFGIAHCNFKLRGKESEGDEEFVRLLAKKYNVPFYKKSFATKKIAEKKGISLQMAARELRYEWLKRLAKEKKYACIATAHHLDDSIETFFINILRGTGIGGLHGVPVKQGNIIRPLLFANKNRIRAYAEENGLAWREDSSNQTDKYLRNNIRHHIIPALKKLNLGFEKTIAKELSYLKDAADIFKIFIAEKKREIVSEEAGVIRLNIRKLKESGYAETLLHELLRSYDFTPETTELIAKRLYTTAGKKFLSPTYRLIKDRDFLILSPKAKTISSEPNSWTINQEEKTFKNEYIRLSLEILPIKQISAKKTDETTALIDADRITYPLLVRRWKPGDHFYPLGMKGRKKLSDFFIDRKLSVAAKENIWVLESDSRIVWIIGYRIDDRFKILPSTKRVLRMTCYKHGLPDPE